MSKKEDKRSQSGRVGHGSTPIHPVSGKKSAVDVTRPLEVPGKLHSGVEIQQTPEQAPASKPKK